MSYEYKEIAAPKRVKKSGVFYGKSTDFAQTVADLLNALSREGWEYHTTQTLSYEQRSWYGARSLQSQELMLFRKPLTHTHTHTPNLGLDHASSAVLKSQSPNSMPAEPTLSKKPKAAPVTENVKDITAG